MLGTAPSDIVYVTVWANFASSIPLKNVSKYPKLAFQKSQLNILQKIEKLVKIEKNVKLAYKVLKWKIVWFWTTFDL